MPPPDICDPACQKIIINSGLMAPIADELAEMLGEEHPLFKPARILSFATRANYQAFTVAIDQGVITRADGPSEWKGCPEATQLMDWVALVNNGGTLPRGAANIMHAWTIEANRRTAALVSGRAE
jgi:hypothetical protein